MLLIFYNKRFSDKLKLQDKKPSNSNIPLISIENYWIYRYWGISLISLIPN